MGWRAKKETIDHLTGPSERIQLLTQLSKLLRVIYLILLLSTYVTFSSRLWMLCSWHIDRVDNVCWMNEWMNEWIYRPSASSPYDLGRVLNVTYQTIIWHGAQQFTEHIHLHQVIWSSPQSKEVDSGIDCFRNEEAASPRLSGLFCIYTIWS